MTQGARKVYLRPLAELVNRALDPLAAKRGFAESSLITQWEAIVGVRVGRVCQPMRLQWPPRAVKAAPEKPHEPGTLMLRVEPGFGLDIQHMSAAIIDRVNTHVGWRCVAKITIRQEPLHIAPRREPPKPPRSVAARALATSLTEGVEHERLRAALITLGERVLATKKV